jgi:hypothetical protein
MPARSILSAMALSLLSLAFGAAAGESAINSMDALEIPNTAEAKKLASVCLNGMYDALTQPASGRLKVSFTVGDEPPYLYSITFDHGWELFRIDAEPLPDGAKQPRKTRAPKPEIWIRNNECQMIQSPGFHAISKYAKDFEMHSIDPLPFDIRLLGIAPSLVEFQFFNYTLEQYKKLVSKTGFETYAIDDGEGGFRIMQETSSPDRLRWFLWLDKKFNPVKTEIWPWVKSEKNWWHQSGVTVRRADFHGVDVPVEAEMFNDSKLCAVVHCDWQEVNVLIDPATFQLESLTLEDRTIVVDHRAAKPFIEKVIGAKEGSPIPISPFRGLFLYVNIGLIVLVSAILAYRWRSRRAIS